VGRQWRTEASEAWLARPAEPDASEHGLRLLLVASCRRNQVAFSGKRYAVFGGLTRRRLTLNDDRWDNPTMIVTLDAKRRLTVPAALAPASPGDYFDARFDAEEDTLVFRRLAGKENWLTVLKACPVSPEDVPPRRRAPARRRKL
jgi:hypothetical protein